MKYKPVPLNNSTVYLAGIPETATEVCDKKDEIIIELQNKLEQLQNTSSNSEDRSPSAQSCLNCKDRADCLNIRTNCCFWQQA